MKETTLDWLQSRLAEIKQMTPEQIKNLAWVGDSVLSLCARRWILSNTPTIKHIGHSKAFELMTSNHFLSQFGKPTEVEAALGSAFQDKGLDFAESIILGVFVPRYRANLKNLR